MALEIVNDDYAFNHLRTTKPNGKCILDLISFGIDPNISSDLHSNISMHCIDFDDVGCVNEVVVKIYCEMSTCI